MSEKTLEQLLQESFGFDQLPPASSSTISSDSDTVDLRNLSNRDYINDFLEESDEQVITKPAGLTETINVTTGPVAPPVKNADAFEGNVSDATKLKQTDLLRPQNLNTIREYMIAKNGVDYETAEAETVVDDFVENMRVRRQSQVKPTSCMTS